MAETKHRTNWEKYFFHINSGSKVTNGCGCDVSSLYWVLLADIIWTFSLVSAHLPLSIEYMNIHFRSGNIHQRCLPATIIIIVYRKSLSFLLPDQTLFRNLIPMMLLVYTALHNGKISSRQTGISNTFTGLWLWSLPQSPWFRIWFLGILD